VTAITSRAEINNHKCNIAQKRSECKLKFKCGERVKNIKSTAFVTEGMTGTVVYEDDCPWVRWDNGTESPRNEDYLEAIVC
jgi:hypothetical protein